MIVLIPCGESARQERLGAAAATLDYDLLGSQLGAVFTSATGHVYLVVERGLEPVAAALNSALNRCDQGGECYHRRDLIKELPKLVCRATYGPDHFTLVVLATLEGCARAVGGQWRFVRWSLGKNLRVGEVNYLDLRSGQRPQLYPFTHVYH